MKTAIVTNSKTGGQWEFETVDEAVEWIGRQERVDYNGVVNGDYTIDDMNDPDAG